MPRFSNAVIAEVDRVAAVTKATREIAKFWNDRRRSADELRMVCGFWWQCRKTGRSRVGFKTKSAAMRDAYYVLIEGREAPADMSEKPRLRVVARQMAEAKAARRAA